MKSSVVVRVIVGALLKGGIYAAGTVGERDEIGSTPLMRAAAVAAVENVRKLLDAGADPNQATRNGATALMWATGDPAKLRRLLGKGATVNASTKDGDTALVTAARRGKIESIRVLLAYGAVPRGSSRQRASC